MDIREAPSDSLVPKISFWASVVSLNPGADSTSGREAPVLGTCGSWGTERPGERFCSRFLGTSTLYLNECMIVSGEKIKSRAELMKLLIYLRFLGGILVLAAVSL